MPSLISLNYQQEATRGNGQRKEVRASDGTLYATYGGRFDPGAYEQVYVSESIDNGATWIFQTLISTYPGMDAYSQGGPSIAIDSDNHLHVVWDGAVDGTYLSKIWYVNNIFGWSTPICLSTYSGMDGRQQYFASLAVDSDDHLHVVWCGQATGYAYSQIWYTEYISSWSTPIRISTAAGMSIKNQALSSIIVASNNCLHVVWDGMATGYYYYLQIWYTKYTTSWSTPIRISTATNMHDEHQYAPSIAIGLNNRIHVVWMNDYDYQIWYAKYTTSWQTPVKISTATGMSSYQQFYPSVATDTINRVFVMWHGKATGYTDNNKVWLATYVTSWAVPVVLQATGRNINPNIRWSMYPSSNRVTTEIDYVFLDGTIVPFKVMSDYSFISPPLILQYLKVKTPIGIQNLSASETPDPANVKIYYGGMIYYIATSSGAGSISKVKFHHPTLGTLYFLLA